MLYLDLLGDDGSVLVDALGQGLDVLGLGGLLLFEGRWVGGSVCAWVGGWVGGWSTRTKNSWRGGSRRRMVTGKPDMVEKMASMSSFWKMKSLSRAFWRSSLFSARIICLWTCFGGLTSGFWAQKGQETPPNGRNKARTCLTQSIRRGSKNMCSLRHNPMPSAPSSRAFLASSGVSALA